MNQRILVAGSDISILQKTIGFQDQIKGCACDASPSVEERALLFMRAQDRVKKRSLFKVAKLRLRDSVSGPGLAVLKLGTRGTPWPLTKAYEQEFEQRVMTRMKERLDQFVDQLADQMNDMMNLRRCGDRNGRGSEGEESKNLFFEGDSSSSDEQLDRPRNTLNLEGFIDWLLTVEEVFEFKESECKKAGKIHLFADEKWKDNGVVDDDYEEPSVFHDDQYEEEIVRGDVGVNLMVRRSCLTPKAVGDDWLKHNIFQSTCTILGKVCTFMVNPGSCDNLIAEEAVQKLGLKIENRPKPYKLQWLKKGDVEYDRNTTHNERDNTYSFLFGGVKITLMPNKPTKLINKPTDTLLTLSQFKDKLEMGDEVHRAVHDNLVRANSKYKPDADQKRRHVDFEVGDFVWAVLTKDRFSVGEYNKLSAKKIGPLEIFKKINSNA
nr:hypothetical protein [Tanacetum cinerariifolium]